MKIIGTKEELNDLVKCGLLEPIDNARYCICLKPDLTNAVRKLEVTYDTTHVIEVGHSELKRSKINNSVASTTTTTNSNITPADIEEIYKKFRAEFPNDILKPFNQQGGISLRTGKPEVIKSRLLMQMKSYPIEDIILAVKFEVWMRVQNSKNVENNELRYMQRMESWINNTENLCSMIERAKSDPKFNEVVSSLDLNNDTPTNGKRSKLA